MCVNCAVFAVPWVMETVPLLQLSGGNKEKEVQQILQLFKTSNFIYNFFFHYCKVVLEVGTDEYLLALTNKNEEIQGKKIRKHFLLMLKDCSSTVMACKRCSYENH
jgi:hypothetical protein